MEYVVHSNGVKTSILEYGVYQMTKEQSSLFSNYNLNMVKWLVQMIDERKNK